jgi:hypothetical protein
MEFRFRGSGRPIPARECFYESRSSIRRSLSYQEFGNQKVSNYSEFSQSSAKSLDLFSPCLLQHDVSWWCKGVLQICSQPRQRVSAFRQSRIGGIPHFLVHTSSHLGNSTCLRTEIQLVRLLLNICGCQVLDLGTNISLELSEPSPAMARATHP